MSNNVKFLLGSEEGEKEEFIEKEKSRLRGQYPDLEVKTVFAFDPDVSQLQDALFSPSLFTSFTLVILKHYEEVKKDSQINRIILRFISEDNPSAFLLVLSTGTSYNLPQSISKALSKDDMIVFWEMFENKKQDWIRNFFRKEGYGINNEAVRYILDMIENNTQEMKNTCSQLALFFSLNHKSGQITLDDISAYVSHTKEEDGFSLFACLAKADLAKSLSCLKKILVSDTRAAMMIIPVLLRQFRLLESFIKLRESEGEDAAFANASAMSTSAVEIKGIKTSRDKQTFRTAAANYTYGDVRNIILYLDEMDTRVKTAGSDDVGLTLELMLFTIIVNKGKVTAIRLQSELFDNSLSHRQWN